MRKLIYGMNLTVDGYVAAPGDDLGSFEHRHVDRRYHRGERRILVDPQDLGLHERD